MLFGDHQISGDASYGPLQEEGSDFNDYVGIRWLYPNDPPDEPEPNQLRCLDCSGFMRMVWGYRHHLPGSGYLDSVPLSLRPKKRQRPSSPRGRDVPLRTRVDPGGGHGSQLEDFEHIDIGDLVFFDGSDDDGDDIDHVGMYLGTDTGGHHRFISSRKTPDDPTFADYGGSSVLDGAGHYAKAFRAIRRL